MKFTAHIAGLAAGLLLFAGTAEAATYSVIPGDSLYKISVKLNTTIPSLMQANRLTSDRIYPSQTLQIPGTATVRMASAAKPPAFTNGRLPLAKGTYRGPVVNNFNDGRSWSPAGATVRKHEGVDIFADKGTPIYSVLDGEIVNFGWNQYGGWRVTIRVDDSTEFYYAHLSKYAKGIGKGSKVKQGQLIGYVGNTGYGPQGTAGQFVPHLHFGIYKTKPSWTAIDPLPYLQWWQTNGS